MTYVSKQISPVYLHAATVQKRNFCFLFLPFKQWAKEEVKKLTCCQYDISLLQ